MRRLNWAFGIFSLGLGSLLLGVAWERGGLGFSLGVLFGILLLVNGCVRLWAARLREEER